MTLRVEDLTIEYSSGPYLVRPIANLFFEASPGEMVVVLGASGSGKTSFLSVLAGILTPVSGTVLFGDQELTSLRGAALNRWRRDVVGLVFQAFNLVPSLTALENVQVTLQASGVKTKEAHRRAGAMLERVGLSDRARHRPDELSGGQQQRVAIARALANDPPLLLADEPTAHLDYTQVEDVVRLLRELATAGRLVVVATHDERILPLADRVIDLTVHVAGHQGAPFPRALAPGEVLFRQGDTSDYVYVIESGSIEILKERSDRREEIVAELSPGQFFGELGPLLGLRRSATARARTATTLTGYTAATFRKRMASGPSDPSDRQRLIAAGDSGA
ncbi:MAG: ATP-binding cassette domain-containing protein [Acidimicrobiales bacterium]